MIRTPFDNLLASGTETGDAYTEPLVHVPLAGEFPEETTRRVVSNQLRKARDLASYGVPAYADKFGDPQAVVDEQGAPLTGFSKKTNTAFDSLGVPRSLIRQPGGAAPVLGDAYEGAEIKTDQKTGAQFKVKPGLPKWRVGTDETVVKRNELAARDKELSKTAAIVGERLSLDQGAYVIGEHQQKAQKRELAGLLKEDFQGQAKIPDGTPFPDVRAQVAKFYDTALADKSASATEWFSPNYTASAKANRDRLLARKAQALGHVDAMEQRAGMLAQQAELIAPAKEQKRQLAEQRIELHLQEMEARGLDTTPIRAQIARAAAARAAVEQKAAAPQQPVAPQAAAAPEKGGNFLTDTGVSLGIGINSVLKMAGDLYGLATGNMDNAASRLGKENIEWYEGKKSGALQKVEKERRAAMDALPEDDETGRAWEWVKATFSSPRMITALLAEQAPNLVPALGAGKLAGTGAAKILLKNASDDAAKAIALKTAGKIGVSAAVGTGAVMQGSDVGGDQYTEIVALLHDMPPEQAAAIPEIADLLQRGATLDHAKLAFALTQARTTGALAGGVSIGSQLLPGARILERAAVGVGGKKLAGNIVVRAGKGFLGEGVQEMVEEGVGLGGKNVLAQPVDPTRRWDKGMGETLAMAGATGGIFGAVGGVAGRGAADSGTDGTATPPPPTPDSPLNSDAIEQLVGIGIPRDKASQMTAEEAMDAVAAADEKLKAGQGTDIAPPADLTALDDETLDDETRRMGLIVNQAAVDNSPQAPMLQAALDAMRAEKAKREAAKPPAAPVIEQSETQGDAASVVAHTDDNAGSTPAPATPPAAPEPPVAAPAAPVAGRAAPGAKESWIAAQMSLSNPPLDAGAPAWIAHGGGTTRPSVWFRPPPGDVKATRTTAEKAFATQYDYYEATRGTGNRDVQASAALQPSQAGGGNQKSGVEVGAGASPDWIDKPYPKPSDREIQQISDADAARRVDVLNDVIAKESAAITALEKTPAQQRTELQVKAHAATWTRLANARNAMEDMKRAKPTVAAPSPKPVDLAGLESSIKGNSDAALTSQPLNETTQTQGVSAVPEAAPVQLPAAAKAVEPSSQAEVEPPPIPGQEQEPSALAGKAAADAAPAPAKAVPATAARAALIDEIVELSARPMPEIVETTELLFTDGKWRNPRGGAPGGVDAVQPYQRRVAGYVIRNPEGTTGGVRLKTREEQEQRQRDHIEGGKANMRQEMEKLDDVKLAEAAAFWREEKAKQNRRNAPLPSAAKQTANQADADKLRDLEKVRYKTAAQEKQIELLKARIKADPSKWSIGDGVAYRVNSGGKGVQLNRGFRITEINAAEKLARIVQVADTGLTSSGGDNDSIAAQWIHVAELVREKKYDKPPAKAAPAAEQPAPAPVAEPTPEITTAEVRTTLSDNVAEPKPKEKKTRAMSVREMAAKGLPIPAKKAYGTKLPDNYRLNHETDTWEPTPAATAAKVGEGGAWEGTVYRGEAKSKPMGSGAGVYSRNAHGTGKYFGMAEEDAARFSAKGTVKSEQVRLEKPYVVRSDADVLEMRRLASEASGKLISQDWSSLLDKPQGDALTEGLTKLGYDGVVVDYKEANGGRQVVQFKPVATPAATGAAQKMPWEMTQARYGETVLAAGPDFAKRMRPHREHVEAALREGKPVPESVLADYPDLKPTPSSPALAAEPQPPSPSAQAVRADAPLPPLLEVERSRGPLVAPYRAALERVEAKLADEDLDADAIDRLERTRDKIEAKLLALESKAVPGAKKETAEERAKATETFTPEQVSQVKKDAQDFRRSLDEHPEIVALEKKREEAEEKFDLARKRVIGITAKLNDGMVPFEEKVSLRAMLTSARAAETRASNAAHSIAGDIGVKRGQLAKAARRPAEKPATKEAAGIEAELPPPSSAPSLSVSPQSGIQDFGEKLAGQARKDIAASMKREISDDDIVRLPLSEIWPKAEVDAIEDIPLAALATAVRAEIPAKPRQGYKVKQWAEKVKQVRGLMQIAAERGYDSVVDKMDEYRLGQLVNKIRLLQGVPREHWGRIGRVENYPESYSYKQDANGRQAIENGQAVKIPTPFAEAEVDGKRVGATNLSELTDKVSAKLAGEAPTARMKFEVRGREGKGWGINKTGDPLYRKLKTFEDSKEAVAFARDPTNYDALVAAWNAVKESDNVKETDVRRETNRDRTGKNWRNGMDATPEMFMESFGFKGAEFGNWVSQGKNVKERQGMLNAAFDALHDLADTVGIPPKAISLNGTLGLGFGSRGHGWASAHFEPGNLVINLTKTRGAGSLAHEWFHALDNYFQRKRNESGLAYGQGDYITNQPETYYESPSDGRAVMRLPEARYKELSSRPFNVGKMDDWRRVEGVRPQVAEAFTELVKVLDASPMSKRAALIDKGKSDGYWSRVIERAARSFENYIIAKMQLAGMSNDYLANVQSVEDFARDKGRYPYLLPDELAPVSAAFDSLFSTFKTEKTDSGVALFSAIAPQSISDVQPKHAIPAHIVSRIVDRLLARWPGAAPTTVIADGAQFPQAIRELAPPGLPLNRLGGAYHDGKVWINAAALGTAARVEQVFMHEQAGHHGVDGLLEGIAPGSRAKLAAQLQEHFPAQWAHVAGNYDAGLQVSETLARIQETFATNEATAKQASAWQRIVDWIRTTLTKAGFRDWTRADVEALLRRGIGRLRGKPGKSGGNAQFSIESDPATPIRHGIKNAMTEADRIFYDLLPRAEIKRRSLESIVAQAKALVENSPEEAERIFKGVEDGSVPVTDINEMVALQLLARTKTAMNRVQATINDGKGKADGLDALMKQRGELKDRLQRLVDTSAAAGREASSALGVRRAIVDEDYSYAGILATMQADKRGVPLTEAEEKIAEVMAPKLEAAAKERTAAQAEVDMQAVYDEVLADIERRIKEAAEFEGTKKEMGERGKKAARAKKAGIDWFKPGAASFSLEGDASAAKSEKGDANAKAPPPIPKDAMKVVMEYAVSAIQSGSAAESAFNAEVEMEFGPKIKPYLADIFKTATKMESLMAVKTKEGKTVRKPKAKETTADIAARIGKERDADPEAPLDPTDIVGMVRANVEAGAGGGVTGEGKAVLAEAIRMTTEQLQEEGIEFTEDEVRDAFTQYGQRSKLKKDALSVKMREIRRIGQLVSAVRDAVQGKKEAEAALAAGEKPTDLTKPKLTGLERDKATQAVRDMDKARIAAIKELQEAASALGIDIGGGGSMASTLAAAKTRMTNAIEDVEREIRTKQRIQRSKKGVNYDAEAMELKAKLEALRKERDAIFGEAQLTDEQRLAAALAAAIRNEQEWNNKLAMARLGIFKPTASTYRLVTSPELEEIKARTAAAREAVAELKADQPFDPDAWLERAEKAIATRTAKLEERLASGDILPPVKAERPTSPALEAARHKYDKLIGELNRQRFKLELANRSRAGKFIGSIAEILQTSRAIITGGELSAVLRQGGFSTLGHPILGMQSASEMLKSFFSERKAHTVQDEVNHWLQGSPMRGKLDITQHSGIRKHHMEEAYMSRWINENIPAWLRKIPVLGFGIETGRRFIAASARAYSTYLNVLRMKVAKNLLKTLPLNPAKPTQAEIQQIADFVNASTGRGKMPKRWQGGAVALNTLFFAPKNFISRVQLLIGQPLWHGTMRTRLIVAKEYARFLIGAATILALAKLGQDDDDPPIETDLRSSDFLKVRFGNTRLDIFSGLIQPLVFAGRTGTLETKTIAGKVKSLHGEAVKYGGDDWSDVAFRFGRTKFAPAPSATFDLLSGRNVVGQPTSATDIGANMILPMTFRDIAHAMEEQGATKGTILSMLAILGMGVNTFSDRKQTPPTGMNADAVVLESRHELPVPSLSQKSNRPVFQGF